MASTESNFSAARYEPAASPLSARSRIRILVNQAVLFWVIVWLVVAVGAVPRLMSYDYGLPYIEYIDELMIYFMGQRERGIEHTGNIRGANYPPGFVQMHVVVQQIMEAQGQTGPSATIYTMRVVVLLVNLVGIIWVVRLAWQIGGAVAALIGGLGWSLSTALIENSVHAIGESLAYPLLVLAILCAGTALSATPRRHIGWAVASVLLGGLIVLFEYRLLVAVVPGFVALLVPFLRKRHLTRRQWLMVGLVAVSGMVILSVAALIGGQSILPGRFHSVLESTLTRDLWDIPIVLFYIRETFESLNLSVFLLVSISGIGAWIVARQHRLPTINLVMFTPVALMMLLIPWITSAVRVYGNEEYEILERHIIPAVGLAFIFIGAAAAQIVYVLPSALLRAVAFPVLAVLVIAPQIQPTAALVQTRQIDPWPIIAREWVDTNLTPGTIIVYRGSQRWFNPLWGGIPHRKWFDWWPTNDILEYPLDEWVEQRGMSYALIPIPQQRQLEQTEAGQALLARMLRLRDFVYPPARREPEGIFYRLWRMQHETNIRFGDHIILTGYDRSTDSPQPGEAIEFTFYWNAPTTPEDNYSLFIHLVPEEGYIVLAQADSAPAVPERLTLTWDEPSETLISPTFTLNIPADLPPGDYRVLMGLYQFEGGARLPVIDPEAVAPADTYRLLAFSVRD